MENIKSIGWSNQYFLSRSFISHFFFSPDGFFLSLRSNTFWSNSLRDIFLNESFFSSFNTFSFLLSRQGSHDYCGFPLGCFFFSFFESFGSLFCNSYKTNIQPYGFLGSGLSQKTNSFSRTFIQSLGEFEYRFLKF
jgi:hypothetical protein